VDATALLGLLNRLKLRAPRVVELATQADVKEAREAMWPLQAEEAVVLHAGLPQRFGVLVAAHSESQQGVIVLAGLASQLDEEVLALERHLDHLAPREGVDPQRVLEDQQSHRRHAQLQLLAIGVGGLVQVNPIQLQSLGVLQVVVLRVCRQLAAVQLMQFSHLSLRLGRLVAEQLHPAQIARLVFRRIEVAQFGCGRDEGY